MEKQARVLSFLSVFPHPSTNCVTVSYSCLQRLFHPLTSLGLLRLLHEEWGNAQEAVVCEWDHTLETSLQMYHNVLLLFSQSGLSNSVPVVDAELLYPWVGM